MTDYTLIFDAITAVATLAVPVVVAIMAQRFNDRVKQWEAGQWRNQELIKARLEYYRELVPQFNDLMCFLCYVGGWKDFTPRQMIDSKRKLDRAFYCAAPLFDAEVVTAYTRFMGVCFATHGSWGTDARLKTGFLRRRAVAPTWDAAWENLFAYPELERTPPADIAEILAAYQALVSAFARNVDLVSPHGQLVGDDIRFDQAD